MNFWTYSSMQTGQAFSDIFCFIRRKLCNKDIFSDENVTSVTAEFAVRA